MPVPGVTVRRVEEIPPVLASSPVFADGNWQVNQEAFSLQVDGVGSFFVRDGKEVFYSVDPDADPEWVSLYLNGQVLVALLHQRNIISFHASSFVFNGLGVMILGETGAGKSSVSLSFTMQNSMPRTVENVLEEKDAAGNVAEDSTKVRSGKSDFLTDDLTPVIFDRSMPYVLPLMRKVKIRKDTADQLGLDSGLLTEAESGTGKKYITLSPFQTGPYPLNIIVCIETGPVSRPVFRTPSSANRFALLRSEVCSWEILAGMPGTEKAYIQQLVNVIERTEFVRAVRPEEISLRDFHDALKEKLESLKIV